MISGRHRSKVMDQSAEDTFDEMSVNRMSWCVNSVHGLVSISRCNSEWADHITHVRRSRDLTDHTNIDHFMSRTHRTAIRAI